MLLAAAAAVAFGCGPAGTRVEPLATSVQAPSNVAVFLSVAQDGEPVADLGRDRFEIAEDGQPLDPEKVSLALLPQEIAAAHRTLILVDATLATTADERRSISSALAAFAHRVRRGQPVGLAAFDGTASLTPVADLEAGTGEPPKLESLETLAPADPSRNLNGAVVAGLSKLDAELATADKPVRVGTLVVVTGGPDVAGRVAPEQVDAELGRSRHQVLAVGIGAQSEQVPLDHIGRSGTIRAQSLAGLTAALEKVSTRLGALEKSHYLLAYCSPARGGVRELTIGVKLVDPAGQPFTASADVRFSAEGFGPGCNSRDTPRFVVRMVASSEGNVPAIADMPAAAPPTPAPAAPQKAAPAKPRPTSPKAKPKPTPAKPPPAQEQEPTDAYEP